MINTSLYNICTHKSTLKHYSIASTARCDVFPVFCIGHFLRVKPPQCICGKKKFELYHGLINHKDTKAKGRNL